MSKGPPEDLTHWLLGAIAGLATFIAGLWKRNESKNAKDIEKLEKRIALRDVLIQESRDHASDCDEKLKSVEIRLASLQGQISKNKADSDSQHET